MTKPDYISQTLIKTTPETLWEALTTSDIIEQYHFMGASMRGAFETGKVATFVTPDGNDMIDFEVISADPPNGMEMMFFPKWMPGLAKSRVVYTIEQKGDETLFTIEHFDIPEGQEGAIDGWNALVAAVKSYLEDSQIKP